jgi:hypothetical protein
MNIVKLLGFALHTLLVSLGGYICFLLVDLDSILSKATGYTLLAFLIGHILVWVTDILDRRKAN